MGDRCHAEVMERVTEVSRWPGMFRRVSEVVRIISF